MRFAHIDEAGTSNQETHCVVAGVVSHPDHQWLALNRHLEKLAKEFCPPELEGNLVFHAKDIWHGTKLFRRDLWPRSARLELLHELAKIPHDFELPVICGIIDKSRPVWDSVIGSAQWQADNYSLAFGICAVHFEYVLRQFCGPSELGTIIAEDVPSMRRHAKWGYNRLQDPNTQWSQVEGIENYMPFQRIIEQPLFAEKAESGILQIADMVAFVISRRVNGNTDVQPIFERFQSQLVILPHQRG